MNTIPSPQKNDTANEQVSLEERQENIITYPHEMNIADGGEFLDDGIRMKDQPFKEPPLKKTDNNSQPLTGNIF